MYLYNKIEVSFEYGCNFNDKLFKLLSLENPKNSKFSNFPHYAEFKCIWLAFT